MKRIIFILLAFVIFSSSALAEGIPSAVVGGLRGKGAAVGLDFTEYFNWSGLYFGPGIELCTGSQFLILYFDARATVNRVYEDTFLFFKGGATALIGSESLLGINFLVGLESLFDIKPLFVEFGVDATKDAGLILQAGYKFTF